MDNILAFCAAILQVVSGVFTTQNTPGIPTPTPTEIVSPTPTPIPHWKAEKTIIESGSTIKIVMNIPKYGGEITGEIEGACNGTLDGTHEYNPDARKTKISGKAIARCLIFFEATAEYSGYIQDMKIPLNVKAQLGNYNAEKNVELSIVE